MQVNKGYCDKKNQIDLPALKKKAILRIVLLPIVFGVLLLIPAGTIYYWEAWVYIIILLIPMVIILMYLLENNPELLERRMRMKEKETVQKQVAIYSSLVILSIYMISGFDKRFGWSEPSVMIVLISDLIVVCSYLSFALVLKENSYASRIVEVEEEQKLITTGPYKIVRHPMYLVILIMFFSTPLALGSYYAVLGNLLIIFLLVARIRNEEKILIKQLNGYREYIGEVKYRLIPGIW